jgi:PAS domain S-box-containing protein
VNFVSTAGTVQGDVNHDDSGFDDERTSPEIVARRALRGAITQPVILLTSADQPLLQQLRGTLLDDGWSVYVSNTVEDLLHDIRARSPQVVLIDIDVAFGLEELPARLRRIRPELPMRIVGLMPRTPDSNRMLAEALADGYDDFLFEDGTPMEMQARATANLRMARTQAHLQKQRVDASMLLELNQTLASSLDMQLILHNVSRSLSEMIGMERCSIVLLDPNDDEAIMVAASEDRAIKNLLIRLSSYPELKRCVETAAPVMVESVDEEPMLSGVVGRLRERAVRTMALFPIVFEEAVIGVLFLRSSNAILSLIESEVQFVQTVASCCAVAVRNARLFDRYRDQTRTMESMRAHAEHQSVTLRKYQDFFEYAADGMAIVDRDGKILYVNREGRRLIQVHPDDQMPDTVAELFARSAGKRRSPGISSFDDIVGQVRKGRFQQHFDIDINIGATVRVLSMAAGGVGQNTGLIVLTFRDVTETRELESELRTTKEFLENLIDNSADAIVASDMNGRIMLYNKGAERIFGWTADDMVFKMRSADLYPDNGAYEVMRRLRDDRHGGRGRLAPERRTVNTKSGEVVTVSMTASIIYEDGEEVATVGAFTDLRDRVAMERLLYEARDQVFKSEKARVAAELAGMAAHELNQPLTSVLGYAEMLRSRIAEDDPRLRRPIDTIFRQAERMAEIVRKIGRITKYETKRYGGRTEMIDLHRASDSDLPALSQPPSQAVISEEGPARSEPPRSFDLVHDPRSAVVRLETVDDGGYARSVRRRDAPTPPPPSSSEGSFDEDTNPALKIDEVRRRRAEDPQANHPPGSQLSGGARPGSDPPSRS